MDFPHGRFDIETLTTLNFFESVHRIINVKIHLHHLRAMGKIIVYAHDFCNIKVRENQNQFSCIAHNFFDMFFLIKGIILSVWGTRDVHIGGTGLTNINFASISNQVEFIDAMIYFLNSLGQLASTLDVVEKKCVEKLTLQFLDQHSYFSQSQKRVVLDIIVSEEGVIHCEKINFIDSLNLAPENGFFF